ncbi:hypothetical protein J1605_006050 [Eschrichtius robustus]|uniref:Tubulin epsilon and delta complex protein 2 n=1 Tax=Eschrichtius robustus TaxID=9764 RepID=A0AB34H670_ESCRO|nr:hypothetical protein J1605_006050 [Eschrichtius robustus]
MLLAGSSRRLVAELRDALDSCAERQRQLERSLRVSRRLLRAWEPAETLAPEPTPGPETNEEAPSAGCAPSPQDLKELELLTQALEKAVRVRKGISKAGEGDKAPSLKILLQLPEAFRKASSRNSRLSATEVEAEVRHLQKACLLLRLRMGEELTADPKGWMQEYRCLLTLEELQAIVGQCLHRLRELCTAVVEQQLGPWPEGRFPRASLPCGGEADPIWSPQLLLYSSTQELQTLASLRLRVAMLHQQIHLEKVLMAELLPLVSKQEPLGPPWLALCRAVHSLLCEGGQCFLTILREDKPAD